MNKWFESLRLALVRRRVEQVLKGLHVRGLMIMAICVEGRYERVYVDHKYGLAMMTPKAAERHLKAIELQEFERALAVR